MQFDSKLIYSGQSSGENPGIGNVTTSKMPTPVRSIARPIPRAMPTPSPSSGVTLQLKTPVRVCLGNSNQPVRTFVTPRPNLVAGDPSSAQGSQAVIHPGP